MARTYTYKLLDAIEEGLIDVEDALKACLKFMSEDDVKEMCRINDLFVCFEDDETEDCDNDA